MGRKNTKYRSNRIHYIILSRNEHQPIKRGTWMELPQYARNINVKNGKTKSVNV